MRDSTLSKSGGSVLVDWQIKELCENNKLIISGYDEDKVHSISYDLTIQDITIWCLKDDNAANADDAEDKDVEIIYRAKYRLRPQEMVFVRIKEKLKMPSNLIGRIAERNSFLRAGIFVSGPIYQPGHNTTIYLRVYNFSDNDILLKSGDSIAQICFEKLSRKPTLLYGQGEGVDNTQYQDEENFRIPKEIITSHVEENMELEKRLDSFEERIYTVFTVFMGAFISVLSLVVVNFDALEEKSAWEIIKINISLGFMIIIILASVMLFCILLPRFSNRKSVNRGRRRRGRKRSRRRKKNRKKHARRTTAVSQSRSYINRKR